MGYLSTMQNLPTKAFDENEFSHISKFILHGTARSSLRCKMYEIKESCSLFLQPHEIHACLFHWVITKIEFPVIKGNWTSFSYNHSIVIDSKILEIKIYLRKVAPNNLNIGPAYFRFY